MPRSINLGIRRTAMFYVLRLSVHRYMARMPTDFGGLPDLMPCFFLLIYTLCADVSAQR